MVDPNTRQGKRTPVTLKIKFKSETLEQFIERYAVDVSQGGIFIRTKEPLAVGTQMKFEFQLRDASPLIAGEGTVVWTRENDPSRPAIAPGMGVRFDRLAEGSQNVLERILAEKVKQAPQRSSNDQPTKPPMFTDTPTRVAPIPVQDALLGPSPRRGRADSEQTPLPKPMPFHSDAEDFDEQAFEEQTKVRALDELVAESARLDPSPSQKPATVMPPDELAIRRANERSGRADSTLADPPTAEAIAQTKAEPDRDSAPGLPSPPAVEAARPAKLLDTSPSPRPATPSSEMRSLEAGKTRLGVEPAKAPTRADVTDKVSSGAPRAIANEPSRPFAPKRPSSAPIIIGILVFVAAAVAGVWFVFLRDDVAGDQATKPPRPTPGSAVASGAQPGSAGSAAIVTPDNGSAAVVVPDVPTGPTVDTVIASSVAKAKITVEGTDQTGPAPLTAKLEKDKAYKVLVEVPGFVPLELDVKGGQDKVIARPVAKPHVISVASEPPGAAILVDNAATGKVTPADIELTAAQAAKPKVHVTLRKAGYRAADQVLDASAYTDADSKLVAKLDQRLAVQVYIRQPVTPNPNTNAGSGSGSNAGSGSGSGSGSAANAGSGSTTPAGTGSGSATTPAAGSGSASTGPAGGSGSGEPELR